MATIYLDNSATTPVLDSVLTAVTDTMRTSFYNPSAAYAPAVAAEQALGACRQALREVTGARGYEVIFTSGGTEADALAILGTAGVQRGVKTFCGTGTEHPAVREAMLALEKQGHTGRVLPVDGEGVLDLAAAATLLDESVALVSCQQVNNETGAVQPLVALKKLMKERCPQALLHVDGVQGFLRLATQLEKDGIDLYSLSAHKIHGPKGVGALLCRKGVRLTPLLPGGGQEGGLRGGTENTPGIAGLQAAINALLKMPDLAERLAALKTQLWTELAAGGEGIVRNGPVVGSALAAPHILNVSFLGMRGEVLLHALEAEGIYVSTGSACSSKKAVRSATLAAMGLTAERLEGAVRFSLSPLNTPEEITVAAQAALRVYAQYKGLRRR